MKRKDICAGQSNIEGINYQQWAALALFLQCLKISGFEGIHLEAPGYQDFNLLFKDEKIICEAKNWKKQFSNSHLLGILRNVRKKISINKNDEILIVSSNISNNLISNVKNCKYSQNLNKQFRSKFKDYNEAESELLPRVRFWQVDKNTLKLIVYVLFSEAIGFWLPPEELREKLKAILIDKFYEGSSQGKTYTKSEFLTDIQSISKRAIKKTTLFNDAFKSLEEQFSNLIQDIKKHKGPQWGDYDISSLSAQPNKMFFVLDQIVKSTKNINLRVWDKLWNVASIGPYYFTLFKIFENNLHTEENKKYILQFFKENISKIRKFYQYDFFDVDVVKITKKILNEDKKNEFIAETFEIVRKLITERRDDIFYLTSRRDSSWEEREIAKLVKEIYERANSDLKTEIYRFIVKTYNLIEDDGNFSHYTPQEIFDVLRNWVSNDFEKRFLALKEKLVLQYDDFYKKKLRFKKGFNGWELIGGATSFWGNNYTVGDRHFIGFVLEPAVREYYNKSKNKKQAWNFILQNYISKTNGKVKNKIIKKAVSKNKPDFLNRAVLPIILERYQSNNKKISDEAFEILKEFILSRRGIPHKSDLIYQALRNNPQVSDDKKWKLVKVSIKRYNIPVTPFIEEITSQLAKQQHKEAKEELKKWLKNPKYYERFRIEINVIQNIRAIMDSDFKYAVSLFEEFINSEYFITKQDSFESYDVAVLLHDILKKDHKRGFEIIKNISEQKSLTKNQQIILCFSLFNYRGNDQSDDSSLLDEVYRKFINPFLDSFDNDINKIVKKLTFSQAREAFVQFAERLARNKKIKEALRIVRVFVNDPDPYLPDKDPEDPENKYNEHQRIENGEEPHSITSTRGWCGWVLMKCSVLSGRDYIKELIDLTEQLTRDKNWYVKHMACFALSQLAQNRLTVLPDNREILFFGKNKREALERAKRVEKIAFKLLADIAQSSDNIKKALAKSILTVFDHIRILNEKDALLFVNTFRKFPSEAIAEAAPLFVFFAEFRKNAFKTWKWSLPGLYDDLAPDKYNEEKFKKILKGVIDKLEPKQRFSFVAQFEHLIRDLDYKSGDAEKLFNIAYKYLNYLSKEYGHEVFRVIYMTIKEGMEKRNHFHEWYNLYIKCLKTEKTFYNKNFKKEKTLEMSWWPSYYNEDILLLIHEQGSKQKFLDAFDLITQFPKELEIHDSDKIISLLRDFSKTNKQVKKIIARLFERNPIKYHNFKNQFK